MDLDKHFAEVTKLPEGFVPPAVGSEGRPTPMGDWQCVTLFRGRTFDGRDF